MVVKVAHIIKATVAIVASTFIVCAVAYPLYQNESRYWAPPTRRDIQDVAKMYEVQLDDLINIVIFPYSPGGHIILEPTKNPDEMLRMIRCFRGVELDCKGRRTEATHIIYINYKENGYTTKLHCDLDPKHAPYVTRNMRSQDLAFVVAEIQKKYEKKPPKQ